MTIKTNEYWIDEPFEEIVRKIRLETREVKFGFLNSFPNTFEMFPPKWIGEIKTQKKSFKLFRTKGSENTSDLSAVGHYTIRGAKPVVVVQHKLHFTVVFGAVGLLIFLIAVFFLLQKKRVVIHPAVQAFVLSLVILFYAYTIRKDLRRDEQELESMLTRVLPNEKEFDEDDEMDGDEEEFEELD